MSDTSNPRIQSPGETDCTASVKEFKELADYNACIFALQDNFEWLYDVDLETGAYKQYIKGQSFSESVTTRLVGNGDFFGDTLKNVQLVVYPEDREAFCNVVNKDYIQKTLAVKKHFDLYYRLITDNRTSWFRMRGVYKNSDRRNVIIGIFNADKEMTAKLRAKQDRQNLIDKVSGSKSAYIVNPVTGRFIIISQSDYLDRNYPSKETYSKSIGRYIGTDVFEPDRKAVSRAFDLQNIVSRLEDNEEYIVRFRDISSGIPRWYEMKAISLSDTEILIKFSDKDDSVMGMMIYEKMKDSYFGLYYINLDSGLSQVMKTGHPDITGEPGTIKPFVTLLKDIASTAEGETVEFLNRISDTDYLKRYFATDDLAYNPYRSLAFEGKRWVNLTGLVLARHEDGTPSVLSLGFSLLDEEASRKEEARIKLKESMEVVGGLANEYTAIYHVNLDTDDYVPYHLIHETEDIRPYYDRCPKFTDLAHGFAKSSLVHTDDRKKVLAFYPSAAAVKEALKDKKRLSMLFKRNYGGKFLWTEIGIVKCEAEDEEAHTAIVGFVEKDQEVMERSRHFREAEEVNRLIENVSAKYNLAFRVNMSDDTFQILRLDENMLVHEMTFSHFSEVREYFLSDVVHPCYRETMQDELDYSTIRRKLAERKSYEMEFLVLIEGTSIWNEMNITQISGDDITIGFAVNDLEITKHRLEDRRIDMYLALFMADLDSGMIKPLKTSPLFKTSGIGEAVPYEAAMRSFADSYEGETKELLSRISNLDYLRQELAVEDRRSFLYKSDKYLGKWVDIIVYAILRHEDGTPAVFTIGFCPADSLTVERQELQRQLRETKIQLEEALSMAESASKAKTRFLNSMSHDIRTPMNAITGFTTMAKKVADDRNKVMNYLDKIDIAGQELLMLINQVLEMSRIESGKIVLDEKPVNVNESYDKLVTVLSEQAELAGLEFVHSIGRISHPDVLADDTRMSQITMNITGNAIKYTPKGGRICYHLIENPCDRKGYASFTFTVEDSGIGMSDDYQKVLFEPFTREKSTTVSKIQGTGLGMPIVKSLVDLLGGDIKVHSELGKGTRFDVTIEFRINEDVVKVEDSRQQAASAVNFKGKRILLVEDNGLNREIARFLLEDMGIIVNEAEDGNIAVDVIEKTVRQGNHNFYDAVLMDIQMPTMDGYEATRKIREIMNPEGIHLPIIAMTANAFTEDRQLAIDAGMDDHIAKPIDVDQLRITLAKFI